MFKFDEAKAIQKYMHETGDTERLATLIIQNLKDVDERLYPCIMAWLKSEFLEFEFHGVTLSLILEKERGTYIDAIHSMDFILSSENPLEEAEEFIEMELKWK